MLKKSPISNVLKIEAVRTVFPAKRVFFLVVFYGVLMPLERLNGRTTNIVFVVFNHRKMVVKPETFQIEFEYAKSDLI